MSLATDNYFFRVFMDCGMDTIERKFHFLYVYVHISDKLGKRRRISEEEIKGFFLFIFWVA